MSRTPVEVRDLRADDGEALRDLWRDLLPRPYETADSDVLADRVLDVADAVPGSRVIVAEVNGEIAGAAYLRLAPVSPISTDQAVHVTHLKVGDDFTRHGAGQSLIEAALGWAEQEGVDNILVAGSVNDRESNRFLARLGLTQIAVMRGSSVAQLRNRLPRGHARQNLATVRPSRPTGQVVAVRRSQRRARPAG